MKKMTAVAFLLTEGGHRSGLTGGRSKSAGAARCVPSLSLTVPSLAFKTQKTAVGSSLGWHRKATVSSGDNARPSLHSLDRCGRLPPQRPDLLSPLASLTLQVDPEWGDQVHTRRRLPNIHECFLVTPWRCAEAVKPKAIAQIAADRDRNGFEPHTQPPVDRSVSTLSVENHRAPPDHQENPACSTRCARWLTSNQPTPASYLAQKRCDRCY
jgi:hypothetical protein